MAAPIPSVNALVDEAHPERPVEIPHDHPLVIALPFVGWTPGRTIAGITYVRIPHSRALFLFSRRCRNSLVPADQTAAAAIHLLILALRAICWTRILDQLIESGLIASTIITLSDYLSRFNGLNIVNGADLEIVANDWLSVEDTTARAGVAAPPPPAAGRGRGAGRGAAPPPPGHTGI